MLSGFLDNIKSRIFVTVVAIWFGAAIMFMAVNGEVFFESLHGIQSYNTLELSDMKNHLPVNGTLYAVYDLVASSYTENTNQNGATSVTDECYCYAVPFDEDSVMLVITTKNSKLDKSIYTLLEACYAEKGYDDVLEKGVDIDGVLIAADSELVKITVDAFNEAGYSGVMVQPYCIDCTKTVGIYRGEFLLGVLLFLSFIAGVVLFLRRIRSVSIANDRAVRDSYIAANRTPGSGGSQSIGTAAASGYNAGVSYAAQDMGRIGGIYDPETPFSSSTRADRQVTAQRSQNSYGTFQSQSQAQPSQNSYGSFQSQSQAQPSQNSYGTFQSQPPQNSYGTFQSQSQAQPPQNSYGTFQSQSQAQPSQNSYGTFQSQPPQNSYGTFQSQSPQNSYGTFQSQPPQNSYDNGFDEFDDSLLYGINNNE